MCIGNEAAQPKVCIPHLMNVCTDPLINEDAKFLDALKDVSEGIETSDIFIPHIKKMKSVFYETRISVNKRFTTDVINTSVEQEDEESIFDILESM